MFHDWFSAIHFAIIQCVSSRRAVRRDLAWRLDPQLVVFTVSCHHCIPPAGAYKFFPSSADYPDLSQHNNIMANYLSREVSWHQIDICINCMSTKIFLGNSWEGCVQASPWSFSYLWVEFNYTKHALHKSFIYNIHLHFIFIGRIYAKVKGVYSQ